MHPFNVVTIGEMQSHSSLMQHM